MRSEVARSLTYRQRAAERMCRFGTKNPLISVIARDDRASKHVGSRTPRATRAFRLMVFYLPRQSDTGGDRLSPCARRRQGSSLRLVRPDRRRLPRRSDRHGDHDRDHQKRENKRRMAFLSTSLWRVRFRRGSTPLTHVRVVDPGGLQALKLRPSASPFGHDSHPAPRVATDVTPQAHASNIAYAALTTAVTL